MADKKITDLQLKSSVTTDLSFPADDGIQSYRVTPSQLYDYIRATLPPLNTELSNARIDFTVAASAATFALKTFAGTNPASTDPVRVAFRNSSVASGAWVLRTISSALSVVVSSGSTLGQLSTRASRIYVYLIDNAGSPELAVSHKKFTEDALVSTTAEGGAGAADSATGLYSTAARSNVAIRCIGYVDNTQTTAGTWASTATKVQNYPFNEKRDPVVTRYTTGSNTHVVTVGCKRMRVFLVGQGGGGSGSSTVSAGNGTNGTAGTSSTFTDGTTTNTAAGGSGGSFGGNLGGAGGTGTINLGTVVENIPGQRGVCGAETPASTFIAGAQGGNSGLGTGGNSGGIAGAGQAGTANTGGGGGGGGSPSVAGKSYIGTGGGGGAKIVFDIYDPIAAYTMVIGTAAGGHGVAGTSGYDGGDGGSGVGWIIEEF